MLAVRHSIVTLVNQVNDTYQVITGDGQTFASEVQPLFAGGFDGSHKFVSHLFNTRDDGFPEINENDESHIVPGMYLPAHQLDTMVIFSALFSSIGSDLPLLLKTLQNHWVRN